MKKVIRYPNAATRELESLETILESIPGGVP
jgi:hypothetical protein